MSGGNLSHTFSSNEFCRHDQLLRWEARFLDPANREFCEMYAEFFRKLAHTGEPRMQNFTNCVIETGNADVIRNSDSRLLQRLVYTRRGLVGPDKKRRRSLPRGK